LHQLRAVNASTSRTNSSEKYIQIISVDNHEFWFMGFVHYDSAVKNIQGALQPHWHTWDWTTPCIIHTKDEVCIDKLSIHRGNILCLWGCYSIKIETHVVCIMYLFYLLFSGNICCNLNGYIVGGFSFYFIKWSLKFFCIFEIGWFNYLTYFRNNLFLLSLRKQLLRTI